MPASASARELAHAEWPSAAHRNAGRSGTRLSSSSFRGLPSGKYGSSQSDPRIQGSVGCAAAYARTSAFDLLGVPRVGEIAVARAPRRRRSDGRDRPGRREAAFGPRDPRPRCAGRWCRAAACRDRRTRCDHPARRRRRPSSGTRPWCRSGRAGGRGRRARGWSGGRRPRREAKRRERCARVVRRARLKLSATRDRDRVVAIRHSVPGGRPWTARGMCLETPRWPCPHRSNCLESEERQGVHHVPEGRRKHGVGGLEPADGIGGPVPERGAQLRVHACGPGQRLKVAHQLLERAPRSGGQSLGVGKLRPISSTTLRSLGSDIGRSRFGCDVVRYPHYAVFGRPARARARRRAFAATAARGAPEHSQRRRDEDDEIAPVGPVDPPGQRVAGTIGSLRNLAGARAGFQSRAIPASLDRRTSLTTTEDRGMERGPKDRRAERWTSPLTPKRGADHRAPATNSPGSTSAATRRKVSDCKKQLLEEAAAPRAIQHQRDAAPERVQLRRPAAGQYRRPAAPAPGAAAGCGGISGRSSGDRTRARRP